MAQRPIYMPSEDQPRFPKVPWGKWVDKGILLVFTLAALALWLLFDVYFEWFGQHEIAGWIEYRFALSRSEGARSPFVFALLFAFANSGQVLAVRYWHVFARAKPTSPRTWLLPAGLFLLIATTTIVNIGLATAGLYTEFAPLTEPIREGLVQGCLVATILGSVIAQQVTMWGLGELLRGNDGNE